MIILIILIILIIFIILLCCIPDINYGTFNLVLDKGETVKTNYIEREMEHPRNPTYSDALDDLLYEQLKWEGNQGYVRELLTMYDESDVPMKVLLSMHMTEEGYYENTKLPSSFIPIEEGAVQWKKQVGTFNQEYMTLTNLNKDLANAGLHCKEVTDGTYINVFNINKSELAGKDGYSLPVCIEFMENRWNNTINIVGDKNNYTDKELYLLYSTAHNGGSGIIRYRASMGCESDNFYVKEDTLGYKEYASSLISSFLDYKGTLFQNGEGLREICVLSALKSGEWFLTQGYYNAIAYGIKDVRPDGSIFTVWEDENAVKAWEAVFGEKLTVEQINTKLLTYVRKITDLDPDLKSDEVSKIYGYPNIDESTNPQIIRMSKNTSSQYKTKKSNGEHPYIMNRIVYQTLEYVFRDIMYSDKVYNEILSQFDIQPPTNLPSDGQSMIPMFSIGVKSNRIEKLKSEVLSGNPPKVIEASTIIEIAVGMVGHYKYLLGAPEQNYIRNTKYYKDTKLIYTKNKYMGTYPTDDFRFDCSSYISFIFNQFTIPHNKKVPVTSSEWVSKQYPKISLSDAKLCDLMYAEGHVAMYIGMVTNVENGKDYPLIVHSSGWSKNKEGMYEVFLLVLGVPNKYISNKASYNYNGNIYKLYGTSGKVGSEWRTIHDVKWEDYGISLVQDNSGWK